MLDKSANPYLLPDNLPQPVDDSAGDHLVGMKIPEISLCAVDTRLVNIAKAAANKAIFYFYPCTGLPGKDPAPDWDSIPGAPGCTAQSCGFRDNFREFQKQNIAIFGISTQCTEEQKEFAERNQIPFPLLSDSNLTLTNALRLPIFQVESKVFIKRHAFFVEKGEIKKVFYPVFPPHKNAEEILSWIKLCYDSSLTNPFLNKSSPIKGFFSRKVNTCPREKLPDLE